MTDTSGRSVYSAIVATLLLAIGVFALASVPVLLGLGGLGSTELGLAGIVLLAGTLLIWRELAVGTRIPRGWTQVPLLGPLRKFRTTARPQVQILSARQL